ncbi:MAG: hypothetical protein K6B12_02150, partial [Clostridiales bacterium]|nr:hypothetical protein [Clostridiales bacterium]
MKPLMKKIGCIVLIFAMMITFIPAMSQAAYADEEVTVAGTQQDTDPPEIDTAVMTVSPKTASPGDTVTISVRVTDASEIAEVSLSLRYPDGTEETGVVMQYNEETELYEYAFPVTEDTVDGGYCVYEFDAADENGNETCSNIEAEPLQFTVAGASSEENAPQIDPSQLEVSPAVAAAGDTVRAGVAVTDDTGVSQVLFYYIDPQTGSRAEAYPASRDDSADMWYADIPITESTPTGVWQLDSIYAKDIYNNETELNAPGTGADFTVKKSIAKATVSISGGGSFAYTGAAITPAVTVTDGAATLTKGTDYTVAYANNTNVGTATITITGSGEYAGTVKKTFKITTNCHVKALWASQHNVGSVLFKWTKLPGESVSGWEVHYRTKKIGGGGWSSWTTKSFSAGTMEFRCPVKADYVVEIHARAKGDKSWSQGIITTPAGGKYQAMKYVYVKNAATNTRVNSVTLYVGDEVKLKPDYEYPVADYTKRPRLYPTHALWDLDAAGKTMLTVTKPDGSKYTGGLIDGAATFKAVKKGTTTLICRA